jgi:hypothetical protein
MRSWSCGHAVVKSWPCGRDHAVRQEKTTDDSTRQTTRHDRRHNTKRARSLGRLQCTFVVNKLWSFVKMLSYRGPYTNFKALLPSRRPCSRLRRVFFRIERNVFLCTFRQGGTPAFFFTCFRNFRKIQRNSTPSQFTLQGVFSRRPYSLRLESPVTYPCCASVVMFFVWY